MNERKSERTILKDKKHNNNNNNNKIPNKITTHNKCLHSKYLMGLADSKPTNRQMIASWIDLKKTKTKWLQYIILFTTSVYKE